VGGRIDALFYCPHTADSACECRKPKPGMLTEIGQRFGIDLTGVPCVGDSVRDLQCAAAVEAQPILVLSGKGEKTLREGNFPKNTVIFPDLAFVATALLAGDWRVVLRSIDAAFPGVRAVPAHRHACLRDSGPSHVPAPSASALQDHHLQ